MNVTYWPVDWSRPGFHDSHVEARLPTARPACPLVSVFIHQSANVRENPAASSKSVGRIGKKNGCNLKTREKKIC